MSFPGFDPSAVALLGDLPSWDAKAYAKEKSHLKAGVMEPGAALIEAVAGAIDAQLTVVKRSSVSPLHRDLRFAAKGAARYKDHLLLTTWRGNDKKISPTLWIRIDSKSVGFASGLAFDPRLRERWREAVGGEAGTVLARSIQKIESSCKKFDVDVAGERRKSVPAPWPADHPRSDLLRMNSFQIRFKEPLPASVAKAAFAGWCTKRLQRLIPVHEWLVREIAR